MAHMDKHEPGSICWLELATTDQAAAKEFYSALFGWTPEDSPIGPDAVYTIFKLQGRDAAACYTLREDQKAMGVPPNWLVYIAVKSTDDAAARAKELGGTILAGPFDAGQFGRMAIIQDPTGAVFAVWQALTHTGIKVTGVDGAFSWIDLSTDDPQRASKFYADLFGWQMVLSDEDPEHDYIHIKNGEHFIGGIPPARDRQPGVPPHWLVYFHTSDCDTFGGKAEQMGARLLLKPMTMEEVGRMAIAADPQGAVFAMFEPSERE